MTPEDGDRRIPGRFVALDSEDPVLPWYRRTAVVAVVAAVTVIAVAGVVWRSSGKSVGHPRAEGLPAVAVGGRIVVGLSGQAGGVALTDPNGGRPVTFSGVSVPADSPLAASADNRYLAVGNGEVIAVDNQRLHVVDRNTSSLLPRSAVTGSYPFTDGDNGLVILDESSRDGSRTALAAVSAVPLGPGAPVSLGVGDGAAGDPQTMGAFVSVAAAGTRTPTGSSQLQLRPDGRVELRDVGHRPVLVATAARLNSVLGQDLKVPVNLVVAPNPSGNAVAITVSESIGGSAGIVVVDRAGKILGSVAPDVGTSNGEVAWSPDGHSLAYSSSGTSGPELSVWKVGSQPRVQALPLRSSTFGGCVWSPEGSSLLCPSFTSTGGQGRWVIAGARGGPMTIVFAAGVPVTWLAGRSKS